MVRNDRNLKSQRYFDLTKNQFCIEDHGKTYIIPTFSKALVVKNLPKEE
jgi:hypothetical protein